MARKSYEQEMIQIQNMRSNVREYVRTQQAQGLLVCDTLVNYVADLDAGVIEAIPSSEDDLEASHGL